MVSPIAKSLRHRDDLHLGRDELPRRLISICCSSGCCCCCCSPSAGGGGVKPILERSTLVIAPEGHLVEQYKTDPAPAFARLVGDDGAAEVSCAMALRVLDAAGKDKRVERACYAGPHAVLRLRVRSAKSPRRWPDCAPAASKWWRSARVSTQRNTCSVAQADEIYLDPMGGMIPKASAASPVLSRRPADKLGVGRASVQVGEYKIRRRALRARRPSSAQAKEADLYWMSDIWQRYRATLRGRASSLRRKLAAGIETMPDASPAAQGDLGKYALQQKFRRRPNNPGTGRRSARERPWPTTMPRRLRQVSFEAYLASRTVRSRGDERAQVAIVVAEARSSVASSRRDGGRRIDRQAAARSARRRAGQGVGAARGFAGGEVFASEQIRREIAALKSEGKPVVVSMGDLAAPAVIG